MLGNNGRVRHVNHGSLGDFLTADDLLFVKWDEWASDLFVRHDGAWIAHELIAQPTINLRVPQTVDFGRQPVRVEAVVVAIPGTDRFIELRPGTSDVEVFQTVFLQQDYGLPAIDEPIHTIVDLGANTGISSVFFSIRFPSARIIALEPERANFRMLCRNTFTDPNVTSVNAAIWLEDNVLSIQTINAEGAKIEDWAFQTKLGLNAPGSQTVEAIGIPTLMRRYGLTKVDLLKIDIEGAEHELFSQNTADWLPYIKYIVIETHERFRPGTDCLVTNTLRSEFDELPMSGENRVFSRRSGVGVRSS